MSLDRTEKVLNIAASTATVFGAVTALILWLLNPSPNNQNQSTAQTDVRDSRSVNSDVPEALSHPAWKVVQIVLLACTILWTLFGWSYCHSHTTAIMVYHHPSVGMPFYLLWFIAIFLTPLFLFIHIGIVAYYEGQVWSTMFHVKSLILLAVFGWSLRVFHKAFQAQHRSKYGRDMGFFDNFW